MTQQLTHLFFIRCKVDEKRYGLAGRTDLVEVEREFGPFYSQDSLEEAKNKIKNNKGDLVVIESLIENYIFVIEDETSCEGAWTNPYDAVKACWSGGEYDETTGLIKKLGDAKKYTLEEMLKQMTDGYNYPCITAVRINPPKGKIWHRDS